MAEEIHTGGLKKFVRKKGTKEPKIEPELERAIDESYEKARIRKNKERRNKIIKISVIILILLLILIIYSIFK